MEKRTVETKLARQAENQTKQANIIHRQTAITIQIDNAKTTHIQTMQIQYTDTQCRQNTPTDNADKIHDRQCKYNTQPDNANKIHRHTVQMQSSNDEATTYTEKITPKQTKPIKCRHTERRQYRHGKDNSNRERQ